MRYARDAFLELPSGPVAEATATAHSLQGTVRSKAYDLGYHMMNISIWCVYLTLKGALAPPQQRELFFFSARRGEMSRNGAFSNDSSLWERRPPRDGDLAFG